MMCEVIQKSLPEENYKEVLLKIVEVRLEDLSSNTISENTFSQKKTINCVIGFG